MIKNSVYKKLLLRLIYGEIFQHPLKLDELQALVDAPENELKQALEALKEHLLIQEKDGYYFVFDENNKISRRTTGNHQAKAMLPKAQRVGRQIYRFPYVEGVGISGSLSKGVLHEDSDFDYFIITKPNRLWVARTFLILYKKIFLLNSRKHFCVNYFIDTENLEIEEKNSFTATEISTLIPVAGNIMELFFLQNGWIDDYTRKQKKPPHFKKIRKPLLTRFLVYTTRGKFGEWLDERFMRLTLKRWERKFGEFDASTFELAMKSRRYVSKHHPNNFQDKVLKRMSDLRNRFKHEHADKLKQLEIEL